MFLRNVKNINVFCVVEKLCKGESYQADAKVMFSRVEIVVNELIRFLGYLPKELWLEQDK